MFQKNKNLSYYTCMSMYILKHLFVQISVIRNKQNHSKICWKNLLTHLTSILCYDNRPHRFIMLYIVCSSKLSRKIVSRGQHQAKFDVIYWRTNYTTVLIQIRLSYVSKKFMPRSKEFNFETSGSKYLSTYFTKYVF